MKYKRILALVLVFVTVFALTVSASAAETTPRKATDFSDFDIEHGTYYYGDWVYYSTSQHRRTKTCSDCGESSYTYGYHSTTTKYTYVSTTQHSVSSYCATCDSTVGSSSNASHTFTYGTWEQYDAYQHRRSINCAPCNYATQKEYDAITTSPTDLQARRRIHAE